MLEMLGASRRGLGAVVVAGVAGMVVHVAVIALSRLAGLRAPAEMSAFDAAATAAIGSIVASTVTGSASLSAAVLGLSLLLGLQHLVATLRRHDLLSGVVDSTPSRLRAGSDVRGASMRHARVSREELWTRLRLDGVRGAEALR